MYSKKRTLQVMFVKVAFLTFGPNAMTSPPYNGLSLVWSCAQILMSQLVLKCLSS